MVVIDEALVYVYCEDIAKRLFDCGYEELSPADRHDVWVQAEDELRDEVITQVEYDFRYERGT